MLVLAINVGGVEKCRKREEEEECKLASRSSRPDSGGEEISL